MPEEKEFPNGLFVSPPRPNAPDFVKARISIKVEAFLEYLSQKDGEWLRLDVKEGFKEDENWAQALVLPGGQLAEAVRTRY